MSVGERIFRLFASEKAAHVMLPQRSLWRAWRRRRRAPTLRAARNILVVRLDEIGDVVLTSAFLRELRRNAPHARITIAVKPKCVALLAACPHVDVIETFAPPIGPWSARHWAAQRWKALRQNFVRSWQRRFDLILLPRRSSDYYEGEFYAFSSGFGCVVALDDFAATANRDARYRRSLTEFRFPVVAPIHDADYALSLIEHLGGTIGSRALDVWTSRADDVAAEQFIRNHFRPNFPLAVMHPSGGNSQLKQWPVENFRTVLEQLSRDSGVQWLVIGGQEDAWLSSFFAPSQTPRVVPSMGTLGLGFLGAILRQADLFVGGDSGPMHIAAAAGTPTVAVFGPTSEIRFAPHGERVEIVSQGLPCTPDQVGTMIDRCQTCIHTVNRCLSDLRPEPVIAAARRLLDFRRGHAMRRSAI